MRKIFILLFFFFAVQFSFAQKAEDAIGVWINPSGEGKIKIFKSGDFFFGNLIWIKNPLDENGKTKLDTKNPDVSKQNRKIQGLLMLTGFTFDPKSKTWVNGQIYDPKSGKLYSCKMSLTATNDLEIRGYIGISLIGRTEVWKRSSE